MPRRLRTLLATTTLAFLTVGTTNLHAEAAIVLYNPFNHGLSVGNFPPMEIDELSLDRVDRVHSFLLPEFNTEDTDYTNFAPFILYPSNRAYAGSYWQGQNYPAYQSSNTPTHTRYRNLHLNPEGAETGLGTINNWGYFDPMEQRFSTTAGSGLGPNGGSVTLSSPNLDTGFGSATGSITPDGEIKLRVDVQRSDGFVPGTPVAEAAIQGTYSDILLIDGGGLDEVAANLSFAASAIAPALDFSRGDFFNYAIGYQAFLFERAGTVTEPVIVEHWQAAGFYWMDARLQFGSPFVNIPTGIRIESIGLTPPDMPGVIESRELLGTIEDPEVISFYKDIREINFDGSSTLVDFTYQDPLMPFAQSTLTEDVMLPTNTPLELVVNFFAVAGGSDRQFRSLNFFIDASNSAGFGIQLNNPTASLVSASGFNYPEQALVVPEAPSSLLVLMSGAFVAVLRKLRRARTGNSAADVLPTGNV